MNGVAPYKNVLSHGFICDEKGFKMSKSLGNGVDPNKIINVYGSDILRLWCATVNYQADVRISENLIKKVSETYRKIRNTFKIMLANLSDGEEKTFNPETDSVKVFSKLSTYVLASLEKTKNDVLDAYDAYDYASAVQSLLNYLTGDCSALYLSIAKDSLYCEKVDSLTRKEVQTVIYTMVNTLSKLLAPILAFTMDEVYQNIPHHKESHMLLEDMPSRSHDYDAALLEEFDLFKLVRNDVLKGLEDARANGVIGSGQEADVKVCVKGSKELFSSFTQEELQLYFVVSKVTLVDETVGTEYENAYVEVSHHTGHKCERCWNYFDELVEIDGHYVCPRCHEVIKDVE